MRVALDRLTAQGTTIALATHDVDFALSWADQAAVVVDGGVRQGPIATMLCDATLLDAARLRQPWQLELAGRLGLAARAWSMDELVAALGGRPTCDRPTA